MRSPLLPDDPRVQRVAARVATGQKVGVGVAVAVGVVLVGMIGMGLVGFVLLGVILL